MMNNIQKAGIDVKYKMSVYENKNYKYRKQPFFIRINLNKNDNQC